MNFPTNHYLCHNDRRRELVRDADVVLLLEVGDPWAQFNTFSDPHKRQNYAAKKDVKIIHISMQDVYIRANYQDFQRYQPADLAINGDAQTSLAPLTEEVKKLNKAHSGRGEKLRAAHNTMRSRARDAAAVGWDASPVTTARLTAELWGAIKNEPWSLVVSDRVTWARRLWPMTEYHQALGGSGGQGVGYAAPAAVGAALANKAKGLLSVTFQPDGDLLYAPGVLWTAAYHKIPLLFLMHNNRGYYQEVMHLQRMASLHKRRVDTAWVGNIIDNPAIDFAKLAQSHGVWAEGPISDAKQIGPALQARRCVKAVAALVQTVGAPARWSTSCASRAEDSVPQKRQILGGGAGLDRRDVSVDVRHLLVAQHFDRVARHVGARPARLHHERLVRKRIGRDLRPGAALAALADRAVAAVAPLLLEDFFPAFHRALRLLCPARKREAQYKYSKKALHSFPPFRDINPAARRNTPVARNTGAAPSAAPKPPKASGTAIWVTLFAMMRMPSASPERPAGA